MELSAGLNLGRAYFAEAFDQSMRYAGRRYFLERVAGVIFVLSGAAAIAWSGGKLATPIVLLLIGLYVLASPSLKKRWWIRRQMNSKVANKDVELRFSDAGISTVGPFSEGTISWDGVERILETPRGVLIWPQKGVHIYLPKSTVSQDVIAFVVSRRV